VDAVVHAAREEVLKVLQQRLHLWPPRTEAAGKGICCL
jgi:hypothetical protein